MGEGWWIASDQRWYPPDAHPDAGAKQALAADPDAQPAPGWWRASDGHWYPPELHQERLDPAASLTKSSARSAVTRSAGAAAPGGVAPAHRAASTAPGTPTLPGVPELFSTPAPAPAAAPPPRPPVVPPVAAVAPTPAPSDDALGLPTGDISIPAGSITADGKIAIELLSAPLVGPGSGPLGGPGAGAPPRDRSFNGVGVARKPGTAHPMPGLRTPDQARPVTPGFGDTHTPPAGSTVRTGLPGSRLGQAPHGTSGS
ncbi:MAG TPA: hypothetical protein VKA05_01335, partial [Acidimicrobiales bacterium]|nr:hypothetical protein [Acidimicrobiales bacterium]